MRTSLILVAALGLRLIQLDKGISGDEEILAGIVGQPWQEIAGTAMREDVYPVVPYLIVGAWSRLGLTEAWLRLYYVVMGLGLVLIVSWWARRFGGGRIALILATCSPMLVWASQYLRPYGDAALWLVVSMWLGWELMSRRGRSLIVLGYGLSTALALSFSYFNWVAIVIQWIYFGAHRRHLTRLAWMVMGALAVVMAVWAPAALRQAMSGSGVSPAWQQVGWHLGGIHLGGVLRGLVALLGFDPYLSHIGITAVVPRRWLEIGASLLALGTVLFLWWGIVRLRALPVPIRRTLGYLGFIMGGTFLALVAMESLSGVTLRPKYLVGLHGLALVAVAIWLACEQRAVKVVVPTMLVATFLIRLPAVYPAEFELARANRWVTQVIQPQEAVLYVKHHPGLVVDQPVMDAFPYLARDAASGRYRLFPEQEEVLVRQLGLYRRIWFIRRAGDLEVFGANQAILSSLEHHGFQPGAVSRFRNVDVWIWETPNQRLAGE